MATVLVAVALLASSIWIAIKMESGLDAPVRPAPSADTDTVAPPRCRFRPKAGLPAARPVPCTHRSPQRMAQLRHAVPSGHGHGREHASQAPVRRLTACSRLGAPRAGSTRRSPVGR